MSRSTWIRASALAVVALIPACDSGSFVSTPPDSYESNDTRLSATPLDFQGSPLTVQGATLLPAGDEDWFSLTLPAGHTMTLSIDHPNPYFKVAPYDSAGNSIPGPYTSSGGTVYLRVHSTHGTFPFLLVSGSRTPYTLTVTTELRPDLVAEFAADPEFTPVVATPADLFTATVRVRNGGFADAGPFTVGFYASLDDEPHTILDLLLGTVAVPGLAVGIMADVTFGPDLLPAGTPPGLYRVFAFVGLNTTHLETDGSNNARLLGSGYLCVGTPPDPREPNNSLAAAIPANGVVNATIGSGGDEDWYSFTADSPSILVHLYYPAGQPFQLSLYGPTGVPLDSETVGAVLIVTFNSASPGATYYARVNRTDAGSTGDVYTLKILN